MSRRQELCTTFQSGSCKYGVLCRYLHATSSQQQQQAQASTNPLGFGPASRQQPFGGQSQQFQQQQQHPNRFGFEVQGGPSSSQQQNAPVPAMSDPSAQTNQAAAQPAHTSCTDPESCRQQIADDFKKETPLWKLTCYGHLRSGPCDVTGDISYEELRAKAYEQGKQGHPLQSIVEGERNLEKSKLTEFNNVLSSTRASQTPIFPTVGSFSEVKNNSSFEGSQTNGPSVFSSFNQIGAANNFGSGARTTTPGVPTNTTFGQSTGSPLMLKLLLRDAFGEELFLGNLEACTPLLRLGFVLPKDTSGNTGAAPQPGLFIVITDSGKVRDEAALIFHEGLPICDSQDTPLSQKFSLRMLENMVNAGNLSHSKNKYSVVLRIWPLCHRAILSLSESRQWTLTRKYKVEWSSPPTENTTPFWRRNLPYLEFLGKLVNSKILDKYIEIAMNPSIADYGDLRKIGHGADGAVYHAKCQNAKLELKDCAIKVKMARELFNEDKEAHILSLFTENNVTELYQAWTATGRFGGYLNLNSEEKGVCGFGDPDPFFRCVFLEMEYCPTTMQTEIESPQRNMEMAWHCFEQTAEAVRQIHAKGIVHCDLKPANIFLSSAKEIKIGDFGHATLDGENPGIVPGSVGYRAPEIGKGIIATTQLDSFSLGAIQYVLFYQHKYTFCILNDLWELARSGKIPESWPGDRKLLSALTGRPEVRPSMDQVMMYLEQRQEDLLNHDE